MSTAPQSGAFTDALLNERDAALEEAAFQRERANRALARVEKLNADLATLRRQLREAASANSGGAMDAAEVKDLEERLHLAVDTSRRLERDRVRMERELERSRGRLGEQKARGDRLERRLKAVEGALRMAESEGFASTPPLD